MTFHLMVVHNTFSSVWVAEWLPFGKELPTRLAMCSHCICLFVILVISRFGFEGEVLVFDHPSSCSSLT